MMKINFENLITTSLLLFVSFLIFPLDANSQQYDIVLLQDESLSMVNTDPYGIRNEAAAYLIDQMSLSGPENLMGLVIFGSDTSNSVDLGRDWDAIRLVAGSGVEYLPGSFCYESLSNVHPRGYTNFYISLQKAIGILESTPDDPDKEKIAILLTDGRLDPWPGDPRFGDISAQFLEQISPLPCPERSPIVRGGNPIHDRYQPLVARADSTLIFAEIVNTFNDKNWKIYAIGFSPGVNRRFLRLLAAATGGEAGIAQDITELEHMLSRILPEPDNIVFLLDDKFCNTRHETFSTRIDNSIQELQISISFTDMAIQYEHLPLLGNVRVTVRDPSGGEYTSIKNPDMFMFFTHPNGEISDITFMSGGPPSVGEWTVELEGIGADICGKIRIKGRRDQRAEITVTPLQDCYPENSSVQVSFSLKDYSNNLLPVDRVDAYIQHINGQIDSIPLTLPPPVNNQVTTDITFSEGPGHYRIKAKILEGIWRQKPVSEQISLKAGCEYTLSAKPNSLNLELLSWNNREVEGELEVYCEPPGAIDLEIQPPVMKNGTAQIPATWFEIIPAQARTSQNGVAEYIVRCKLPRKFPEHVEEGKYRGELIVKSPAIRDPLKIPVEFMLKVPRIWIKPQGLLDYNFRFMVLEPPGWLAWFANRFQTTEKSVTIETDVNEPIEVIVRYPSSGMEIGSNIEDRIHLDLTCKNNVISEGEGYVTVYVKNGSPVELCFKAVVVDSNLIRNPNLDDVATINPRPYRGELSFVPAITKNQTRKVIVDVPDTPILLWFRNYGWTLIVFTFLVFLYLAITYKNTSNILRGHSFIISQDQSSSIKLPFNKEVINFSISVQSGDSFDIMIMNKPSEVDISSGKDKLTSNHTLKTGRHPIEIEDKDNCDLLYQIDSYNLGEGEVEFEITESTCGSKKGKKISIVLFGIIPIVFTFLIYVFSRNHI